MAKVRKAPGGAAHHSKSAGHTSSKLQKKKTLGTAPPPQRGGVELVDPRVQAQLKTYDEALALFHQQKFARAKQELEEVLKGPSKELADRARMHLKIAEQARKAAPKADHIHYALAALDCLTGEADSALENLKIAIQLRPENRYHARNDEDFAFLQEDPRFTELLYPEKDGLAS